MTSQDTALVGALQPSNESNSILRAAVYARTSTTSQKYGYSIGEQVRLCVDRCHLLGWEVHYIFQDEAESGSDTDRPMFQRMISMAEADAFDVLVFWKLDRFSRSIMHAVQLEKQFSDMGLALHSVTEQLDTTSPAGRFNFRNIANAAEFERELIKQRTKMGHLARAMEHKWPNSSPPLGYEVREDGYLEVVPSEATLVRRIFREYIEQESMPAVAEVLNQDQRFGKGNMQWTPNSVGAILRNPIYTGEYSVRSVSARVDEYRILSDELFQKATDVRTRFQTSNNAPKPAMAKQRKRRLVTEVLDKYLEYLED
ncbi:recombinase family protein [Haloarchaeobius amylolyticus]|uniref:recombinase family protein n=1 Tax=Haloarchaeobius amylolyticus TaxID=1198296 RepID=UPI00226F7572|nr:recombinase family protein [Haloarchaeobius amylolyticus]